MAPRQSHQALDGHIKGSIPGAYIQHKAHTDSQPENVEWKLAGDWRTLEGGGGHGPVAGIHKKAQQESRANCEDTQIYFLSDSYQDNPNKHNYGQPTQSR